jgi:hypothetical protein
VNNPQLTSHVKRRITTSNGTCHFRSARRNQSIGNWPPLRQQRDERNPSNSREGGWWRSLMPAKRPCHRRPSALLSGRHDDVSCPPKPSSSNQACARTLVRRWGQLGPKSAPGDLTKRSEPSLAAAASHQWLGPDEASKDRADTSVGRNPPPLPVGEAIEVLGSSRRSIDTCAAWMRSQSMLRRLALVDDAAIERWRCAN